jgi:cell division protein FtsQ
MSELVQRRAGPRARPPEPGIRIPLSPARLRLWLALGLIALATFAALVMWVAGGGLARLGDALVAATARAGLEVREVSVTGTRHAQAADIRAALLAGDSDALLALDLTAARERVEALPLIHRATVARHWPDRVTVVVEERVPAAIFSRSSGRAVIDAEGVVLAGLDPSRFPALPLVAGEGAPAQLAALRALLATQPVLAAQVDSAAWRGGRRWDLRMKTGEIIALPEGYDQAQDALARFAAAHAEAPVLGQGHARIDLRLPGRMVVRVTREPGAEVPPAPGAPI